MIFMRGIVVAKGCHTTSFWTNITGLIIKIFILIVEVLTVNLIGRLRVGHNKVFHVTNR